MTASLIVVALGAVAAAVGTGVLAARSARTPRLFLVTWTVAIFGLAVALAAQCLGYLAGYGDLIFRSMAIGAQAIAPLALCLGLVELIAGSVPGRFAMRLGVWAISVIVLVVLGTDPLNPSVTLGTAWPDPARVYQLVPVSLIEFLAAFTIATALGSSLVVMVRSGRGQVFEDVVKPTLAAAAAAAAVAVPGVAMLAHVPLGSTVFALTAVLAAGLTWFAATTAERRGLADHRRASEQARRYQPADRGWSEPYDGHEAEDTGGDYLDSAYRGGAGYESGGPAGSGRRFGDPDADISYPALAALAAESPDPGDEAGRYGQAGRYGESGPDDSGWSGGGGRFDSGRVEAGPYDSGQFDSGRHGAGPYDPDQFDSGALAGVLEPYGQSALSARRGAPAAGDGDPKAQLFGQITIYTMLDDRLDEFDRLTERVVEQVRAREPGTLVYIVHAVPTAPMQRILYEVYQDRSAYDEHLRQPYVMSYVEKRRSMVLATNAIELGLQQAKVSPLPSYSAISDILSESGIDLTGVTRSPSGSGAADRRYGRPAPGGLPAPGTGRYGSPGPGADRPGYEGWGEMRDEDSGYR